MDHYERIITDVTMRRTAVEALFSDDIVSEYLVIKGGNAIEIVHAVPNCRASFDIDASIPGILSEEEKTLIEGRVRSTLEKAFAEIGYRIIDYTFREITFVGEANSVGSFWGGYRIEFKILSEKYGLITKGNLESKRRRTEKVSVTGGRKFRIEISKCEYCDGKETVRINGYDIYVYSPAMIVAEKLRAICQQSDEYRDIVKSHPRPRGRDFYDIYVVKEYFGLDTRTPEFVDILGKVFAAKKVGLGLLREIAEQRVFHELDFAKIANTIKPGSEIRPFDFYFDYVLKEIIVSLQTLRVI
jgi:hypothetical protein